MEDGTTVPKLLMPEHGPGGFIVTILSGIFGRRASNSWRTFPAVLIDVEQYGRPWSFHSPPVWSGLSPASSDQSERSL